jgi:hypothetical protein
VRQELGLSQAARPDRQVTDFYCDPVPKHDAFNRDFKSADAANAQSINDMPGQAAVAFGEWRQAK